MKPNIRIRGSYRTYYKLNVVGKDGAATTVAIPPDVIGRKAEEVGLNADEFINCHKAIAHYDNFDGVFYTFERVANADERE